MVYAAAIFVLSSLPAVTAAPGFGPSTDKLYHVLEFVILAALAVGAVGARGSPWRTRAAIFGFAIAAAYGVADEIHQMFVPTRNADPWDALADIAGAAAGAIVAWSLLGCGTFGHPSRKS